MSKARILLVIDALYIGGTETHVLTLAKEFIKNNVFVSIAANKTGSLLNSFEALKCPIYHIDFPRTIGVESNHEIQLIGDIERIIESEHISHVHIHQTPSGYLAGKAAKNKGVSTVLTIHGTYYPKHEIQELLNLSDAVICVSPPLCNYVKSFGIENPYLIPNGISLEEYPQNTSSEDLRSKLNIPENSTVVLYASRIAWAKAHVCSTFLRACKDLKLSAIPNLHAIVVGDGNKLADIQFLAKMIEEICDDKFIHIVGEQLDMDTYYAMADCIVGTGRVALEGMASGKQIIAVGNHGHFGVVNDSNFEEAWSHYFGDHGSKVACSRHVLRDELKKILVNKEQLELEGVKSREIVEENFNIHTVAKQILEVYSMTTKGGINK